MKIIQQFFINIERDDVDSSMENLVSNGIINSIDIISLVMEIEKYYRKPLDIDYILPENFENFENIKNMLEKAMK